MYLNRYQDDGSIVGVFYLTENWEPIILEGHWKDGQVRVSAYKGGREELGRLQGDLSSTSFTGVWAKQGSGPSDSLQLNKTSRIDCEKVSGQWKQFSDPQWPISFSYPDSWRMESNSNEVTLSCPDPRQMEYEDGSSIRITHGTMGKDSLADLGLVRCGNEWKYGESECDCREGPYSCPTAQTSKRSGITAVDRSASEWRQYCRGAGFVGLSEGRDLILLTEHNWIEIRGMYPASEIVDEIINSAHKYREIPRGQKALPN